MKHDYEKLREAKVVINALYNKYPHLAYPIREVLLGIKYIERMIGNEKSKEHR